MRVGGPFDSDFSYSAKQAGARGDGVTDDRVALKNAAATAARLGVALRIPAGTYYVSKYVDISNVRGLRVFSSEGAVIRYASANVAAVADGTAVSDEQARSALLLRYCSDVVVQGITFIGDNEQNITSNNVGCGVYATHSVGTVVTGCGFINGGPFVQDVYADTTGTGDSLTINGSTMTLDDAAGAFSGGHRKCRVTIANATNPSNNGTYQIDAVSSATRLTFTNPGGVTETSGFNWSIDDADRGTRIEACRFSGCRRPLRTGHDSVVRDCYFEHPMNFDATGRGTSFTLAGSTITFIDRTGPFLPSHVGKWITIANATTAGNNVRAKITAVLSSTTITYENGGGATEAVASTTTWWIMNGDKTGTGAGVGAISKSGTTVTFTADENAFHASDIGKVFHAAGATNAGNNNQCVITGVPAANKVTFENASGANEDFSKGWAIDAYDNGKPSDTYGSTHMIYLFAGRSNVLIEGCTFRGARTTCVKISGSTASVRDITIRNCSAYECGSFCTVGADDTQDHSNITVEGNSLVNCGTGRYGWSQSIAMEFLGCRGLSIRNNKFYYTRNAISKVDGRNSTTGLFGIRATRYIPGVSQPLEDVVIEGNTFTSNPNSTTASSILATPIVCDRVGQRAYYATAGTLTKSGNTMTLTHSTGSFGQSLVGCTIQLVNSASGNDGTFTITAVGGSSTLSFENAAGTGGGVSAGTYRIQPPDNRVGGGLLIKNNQIHYVGTSGIQCTQTVAPEIVGNVIAGGGLIECTGCVAPRIVDNREINTTTSNARIRLNSGTSWPYVDGNIIANPNFNTNIAARDIGIGVDNGTPVDYPLLGKAGRAKPTQAQQEIVIAYGTGHVDGDTILVTGTTYTYKATAPGANQFNSFAGLVALIDAQANHDCADYGAQFSPAVTTQHLRIRHTVQTTADSGQIYAQVNTLNPTALVMLRNKVASNLPYCHGRGAGSAGPTADKTVVWSPATTRSGLVVLVGAESTGAALLAGASGFRSVKNGTEDPGCCEVLQHGTSAGTEEFRWVIV